MSSFTRRARSSLPGVACLTSGVCRTGSRFATGRPRSYQSDTGQSAVLVPAWSCSRRMDGPAHARVPGNTSFVDTASLTGDSHG